MFITCPEFSVYNQGTPRVRTSGWMRLPIEYLPHLETVILERALATVNQRDGWVLFQGFFVGTVKLSHSSQCCLLQGLKNSWSLKNLETHFLQRGYPQNVCWAWGALKL